MTWVNGDKLTSTNLNNKTGLVFSVMDSEFGAAGDGTTDDTAAIQAAIDAAQDAKYGTVFLPPRPTRYIITSSLNITAPITFCGVGTGAGETPTSIASIQGASVIQNMSASDDIIDVTASGVLAGLRIRDLMLIGNRDVSGVTAGSGIRLNGGTGGSTNINSAIIERVTIHRCRDYGLWLNGLVFNSNFWGVYVRACLSHGFKLDNLATSKNAAQNRFIGCTASTNDDGFHQTTGGINWVTMAQIVANRGRGAYCEAGWLDLIHNKYERNDSYAIQYTSGAADGCVVDGAMIGSTDNDDPQPDYSVHVASRRAKVSRIKIVTSARALISDIYVSGTNCVLENNTAGNAACSFTDASGGSTNSWGVVRSNQYAAGVVPGGGLLHRDYSTISVTGLADGTEGWDATNKVPVYYDGDADAWKTASGGVVAQYLYLRSDAAAVSPGRLSAVLPVGTLNDLSGATPHRQLTIAKGTASAGISGSSLAQTAHQDSYFASFITGTFTAAGTIAAATWETGITCNEGNAAANSQFCFSVYVWRSGTGVIGYVYDSDTALGNEWGPSTNLGRVCTFSGGSVAYAVGDRLVVEVWRHAAQANATAYTQTINFDDDDALPTEGSVNAGSSYVKSPQWLPLAA